MSNAALANISCVGTEEKLTDCNLTPVTPNTECGPEKDAHVVCQGSV